MRRILSLAVLSCGLLSSQAFAAPLTGTYVPSGATTGTGPWTLTSTDSTYSELDLVLSTPVLFSNLTSLSVDYNAVLGGIREGAPRLYLLLDTNNDNVWDQHMQVQFGPAGSFVDLTLGAGNTGNLMALTDVGRYDLSGMGLSAYTDRAAALAAAGSFRVLEFDLVIDSFSGHDRNFIINSINAEGTAGVPEPASLTLMGIALLGFAFARRRTSLTTR